MFTVMKFEYHILDFYKRKLNSKIEEKVGELYQKQLIN